MTPDRNAKRPAHASASRGATTRHTWAIDKLEEGTASIEHDGDRMFNVPRSLIPRDAREGDVLDVRITTSAENRHEIVAVDVRVDRDATKAATAASAAQVKRVARGRDPGGDIAL
jgi:hypothetical protein